MSISTELIPVIHDKGPNACGGLAFSMKRPILENELINADNFVWPNGEQVLANEQAKCAHCKAFPGLYPWLVFKDKENQTYSFRA